MVPKQSHAKSWRNPYKTVAKSWKSVSPEETRVDGARDINTPILSQKYCRTNGRRIAIQMGGVLPYKWEAYCHINWRCIAALSPRPVGVGVSDTLLEDVSNIWGRFLLEISGRGRYPRRRLGRGRHWEDVCEGGGLNIFSRPHQALLSPADLTSSHRPPPPLRQAPGAIPSISGLQKGPAERGHVKKRQKSSKSVKKFFDTFRQFLRRAKNVKNRQKVLKSFSTLFDNFRAAPFFRPLLQSADSRGADFESISAKIGRKRAKTTKNRPPNSTL